MALPIMFNLRYVSNANNKFYMALANFSMQDSGVLFECEYDEKFDAPWGITVNQVKGGEFSYFANLSNDKLQKFSEAMSQLINAFYGFDTTGKPIFLKQHEIAVKLAEQVFVLGHRDTNLELIPLGLTQSELMDRTPNQIPLFASMPKELLQPNNVQKTALNH